MTTKQTPRERVIAAVHHKGSGGLPIDLGGSTSTSCSIFSYLRLREYLGLDKLRMARVYDFMQMLADFEPEILDRVGSDVQPMRRLTPCRDLMGTDIRLKDWKPFTLHTGDTVELPGEFCPEVTPEGDLLIYKDGQLISRMPHTSYYFDMVGFPYADCETPEDVDNLHLTGISDEEVDFIVDQAIRFRAESDRALLLPYGGKMFETGLMKWGYENFLINMMDNPEMVEHYFDILSDICIEDMDRIMARAGGCVDIVRFGDDLGLQTSLLVSRDTYKKSIKPYHKKVFRHLKDKYPELIIGFHCCGAIRPIIGDLIDCGVDMLNPVQITAQGMDPAELKREFGRDVTFWGGGADMQFFVPNHTPDEIREETKRLIGIFGEDGGFVFAATHNMQADTPPEKIMAIYETAQLYR